MHINPYLALRLQTAQSNLRSATQRVARVTRLADLQHAAHVAIPAELRAVIRSDPAWRALASACSTRAQTLVETDLAELKALTPQPAEDRESFHARLRNAIGELRARSWCHLQGHEPRVLQYAIREAERLLAQVQRKAD